jgi:hypothetical protein
VPFCSIILRSSKPKTRIVVAADISPDGRYIAALEAPARLEDGTVLEEYKVHILT